MSEKSDYIYAGKPCSVKDASGVKGTLIQSEHSFIFRVHETDGSFSDYAIKHDDLAVTIEGQELAAIYQGEQIGVIGLSPSVLGLKRTD